MLPLALGGAVSPTLLAVTVLTLSGRVAPRLRTLCFLAGCLVVLAGVTAVVLPASAKAAASTSHPPSTVSAVVDLVFAAVLAALGVRAVVRRHAVTSASGGPERTGVRPAFHVGLGITMMATNLSTLALYIPAVKDIGEAQVVAAAKAFTLALVVFIVMLPVTLPLALTLTAPRSSDAILRKVNEWVHGHSRQMTIVLCFGFAAYLLWRGLDVLLS